MLPEALLYYFFYHFCFNLQDACRFLIAIGRKPHGVYCDILQRAFLRLELPNYRYYKIRSYAPMLRRSGEHAQLQRLVLCDTRYRKQNRIIFNSPAMRVMKVYRKNKISLQDPTTFFHLRLRGFCSRFVRHHRDYKMKDFKTYFKFDHLVIRRFDQLSGNCYLSENLFVCVSIAIHYDAVEKCFYPHVSDYRFLSR